LVRITPCLLPDLRLGRRLQQLVDALAVRAEAALSQALPRWAERKAAYRFFAHHDLSPATILAAARPAVVARVAAAPGVVLAVQDTTTLNLSHHPATDGLGPLGGGAQGFHVHSCLAIEGEHGVPLGLLAQQLWARDPDGVASRATHHQRLAAEKESQRWAATEQASLADLPARVPVVSVADREGDIYTWFSAPRPAHAFLLVRVAQTQRQTEDGRSVQAAAQAAPVRGHYAVPLRALPGRPARTARCRIRVAAVTLRPPQSGRREPGRDQPVPLTVLLVEEEQPPADGTAPLCWLLLTSWPVARWEDAARVVWWYTQRWLIERYHYVLKTGCQVEALQVRTEARLERAVAVYALVAVQVLWLTYLAREQPELPCTVALTATEWQALWLVEQPGQPLPAAPPPLGEAMRAVARLGGFLGRRGDGAPGPLVLWRGLGRLRDLALGLQLARGLPTQTCG
jgi:hypothetical protein